MGCTMDYDTLCAGREMDALIAEKVMGWDHTHDIDHCEGDSWYSYCRNCSLTGENGEIMCWHPGDPILNGCTKPPPYSTSIEAAWKVVEKLCFEYGMTFGGHVDPSQHGWQFGFGINEVMAGTLPLSICRAALKAMEG